MLLWIMNAAVFFPNEDVGSLPLEWGAHITDCQQISVSLMKTRLLNHFSHPPLQKKKKLKKIAYRCCTAYAPLE